jgi:hypothetical protein
MAITYANSITLRDVVFRNNFIVNSVDCSNVKWWGNSLYYAFDNCRNLTAVSNIHSNITNMEGTFKNCQNLVSFPNIPNNVISIKNAFYNCKNINSIPVIPESVTNIDGAFNGCVNITTIPTIPNVTNLTYTFAGTSITDLPVIPDSVTSLAGTFANCMQLSDIKNTTNSLVNNNTITNMSSTFENSGITSILALPTSASNLSYIFKNCTNLIGTAGIGAYNHIVNNLNLYGAFDGCTTANYISGVYNATVPNYPQSVNICKTYANCINATGAYFTAYNCENKAVIQTFANCTNLNKIAGYSSPAIGTAAFGVRTRELSGNPQDISGCFSNCTALEDLILPDSITTMVETFAGCTNLAGIAIQSENVVNILNCFRNTSQNKNVYIPFKNPYTNEYTTTYNTFTTAGYDTLGTKENVYLKDYPRVTYDKDKYTVSRIPQYQNDQRLSAAWFLINTASNNYIVNIAEDFKYYGETK